MSVIKTSRYIYVYYSNRLRFLAEISTMLQEITFLDNLKTIANEANMERRQIISFFHLLFLLYLFTVFLFALGISQNLFSCGPNFDPFRSVKYLHSGQNLSIWTDHHTFVESRLSEAIKNPYYILSPEESQKKGIS